jgi:hypothetical protein
MNQEICPERDFICAILMKTTPLSERFPMRHLSPLVCFMLFAGRAFTGKAL